MLLGAAAGWSMRQLRGGRRLGGVASAVACLVGPVALAAFTTVLFPIVGLWDAITEGFLCGVGLLFGAHTAYAEPLNGALTAGAVVVALLLVEAGARLFAGAPPAYPLGDGPHLLLTTLLRTTGPDANMFHMSRIPSFLERRVMKPDPDAMGMAARPPGTMVTREIVCSIAYGSAYTPLVETIADHTEVLPERFTPRSDVSRRVLHVGDSMVFGANVPRGQTFVADLEKLEPDVQHINAGISGTSPDDYLLVARGWVARQPVDVVVMYLFAGNDLVGMDGPHPCSNWEPILAYADGHAELRYPAPQRDSGLGARWLLINSPLPFIGRVLIAEGSVAAAHVGGLFDRWTNGAYPADPETQYAHLKAILTSARDELRERHIAFIVVVLPAAEAIGIQNGPSDLLSRWTLAITNELGVRELDATDLVADALHRGERPVQDDHVHFNEAGHSLMAQWLHDAHVAAAAGS